MTSDIYRRVAGLIALVIVLIAGLVATSYFARNPNALPRNTALAVDPEPTDIPYPTMPGYSGTPTIFPTYDVPSMTPVPGGSDSDFGTDKTPVTGYTPAPTPQPSDPWLVVAHPLRITNTNFSTQDATLIISGTVSQVQSARWSTLDGTRPANPWLGTNTYTIFKPVLVTINSYLKGSGLSSNVSLFAVGGKVGNDSATWDDGLFTFAVGDHVILFLNKDKIDPNLVVNGQSPWQVVEHYTLDNSGQASNALQNIPTQQLLDEISTALK